MNLTLQLERNRLSSAMQRTLPYRVPGPGERIGDTYESAVGVVQRTNKGGVFDRGWLIRPVAETAELSPVTLMMDEVSLSRVTRLKRRLGLYILPPSATEFTEVAVSRSVNQIDFRQLLGATEETALQAILYLQQVVGAISVQNTKDSDIQDLPRIAPAPPRPYAFNSLIAR